MSQHYKIINDILLKNSDSQDIDEVLSYVYNILTFNEGNIFKYIARCYHKDQLEADVNKALHFAKICQYKNHLNDVFFVRIVKNITTSRDLTRLQKLILVALIKGRGAEVLRKTKELKNNI